MTALQKTALSEPWMPGMGAIIPGRFYQHKSKHTRRLLVEPTAEGLVWHAEIYMGDHESNTKRIERLVAQADAMLEGVGIIERQEVRQGSAWLHVRRPLTAQEKEALA